MSFFLYLHSISHTSNTMRLCGSDLKCFPIYFHPRISVYKNGKSGLRPKSQHLLILSTNFWKSLYFSWNKLQEFHQILNLENIQNIFAVVIFYRSTSVIMITTFFFILFFITTIFKTSWRRQFHVLLVRVKSGLIFFLNSLTLLLKFI